MHPCNDFSRSRLDPGVVPAEATRRLASLSELYDWSFALLLCAPAHSCRESRRTYTTGTRKKIRQQQNRMWRPQLTWAGIPIEMTSAFCSVVAAM
ncbi:hypothetical protein WJX73_009783 [Symbiochloris irregularis]|uniref:Uncharacterized protein n=1 Tax=Symbiochloris irregularis TaxID=706552 RepID=A0AAW1P8K1_9CHLO